MKFVKSCTILIFSLLVFPMFTPEANANEELDVTISWIEKNNSFRGKIVSINKGSENNRLRLDRENNKTVLVYIKKTNTLRAWGTGLKGAVLVINGIETPKFKKPGKRKWFQVSLTRDEFDRLLPSHDDIDPLHEEDPVAESETAPELEEVPIAESEATPEVEEIPVAKRSYS